MLIPVQYNNSYTSYSGSASWSTVFYHITDIQATSKWDNCDLVQTKTVLTQHNITAINILHKLASSCK